MDSSQIFEVIEQIAESKGNSKRIKLKAYLQHEEFGKVILAALNPFVTYGIAKIPEYVSKPDVNGSFDKITWDLLDDLAKRNRTGNQAIGLVKEQLEAMDERSAELFKRILKKDLRAGFGASTVNKVKPGFIPTFDCMLAHKYDEKRVKSFPQYVQSKLDGVRALAFISMNEVRFFSRSGKEFTTFEHLKEPLMLSFQNYYAGDCLHIGPAQTVLDGEIVSGSFNKTVSEVRKSTEQAVDAEFHVFDMLHHGVFNGHEKKGKPIFGTYRERSATLRDFAAYWGSDSIKVVPHYVVNSYEEIDRYHEAFQNRGLEGTIVKDPDGLYHRRRNYAWMKIKSEETIDAPIVGAFEGTGKYVGMLGGLIVDYNGVEVRVGGGFSDQQRIDFWKAYKDDLKSVAEIEMTNNILGRLIEIEYHEETPDGSLRHPRFYSFRDDKVVES